MPEVSAKPRKTAKKPAATKMCLHCNQVRNLSDFYSNRDWLDQAGKDIWCKKCITQIKTKDEMREYFFENHRKWDDRIWASAEKKAKLEAANNQLFQRSSDDRKQAILEALTCQHVPPIMQLNYTYVDNSQDINIANYEEAKKAGRVVDRRTEKDVKTYNAFFNGDFKPSELEYLEEYYKGLENDFQLTDVSLRDNAKKLAKAALTADKIQNEYLSGRCSIQDLNNAIAQYDLLMKTGNFAACKRKPGDKGGISSWAEITAYCETNGKPCVRKIEWDRDIVDQAIESLEYIVQSLRAEGNEGQ